jgi:orotidine-5'-phosphate decarboxylase
LKFEGKWAILLALTSNSGALDFQHKSSNGLALFEEVVQKSQQWGSPENLMYVVGATRGEDIKRVRNQAPNHFFLVPGVGAQGGSLSEVVEFGMNNDCGLLVNSSRGIIYSSSDEDFASSARIQAQKLQEEMSSYLQKYGII